MGCKTLSACKNHNMRWTRGILKRGLAHKRKAKHLQGIVYDVLKQRNNRRSNLHSMSGGNCRKKSQRQNLS